MRGWQSRQSGASLRAQRGNLVAESGASLRAQRGNLVAEGAVTPASHPVTPASPHRHSHIPLVTPAPHTVIPAPHPSFPRKRESSGRPAQRPDPDSPRPEEFGRVVLGAAMTVAEKLTMFHFITFRPDKVTPPSPSPAAAPPGTPAADPPSPGCSARTAVAGCRCGRSRRPTAE